MKRIGLALALALVLLLAFLPGSAGAHRQHRTFVGCCVFIAPDAPFVVHHFHHGFVRPFGSPTLIIVNPVQPVWVPGFWQWTGAQWAWVPGQWVFPDQRVLLRNPCD